MKRLCIYLTYDKENRVDPYIGYMLKELQTCVDHIAVICNYKEVACGSDILHKYANQIFYRENLGFDAGGFKDALCHLIGWDKVKEYDELVLANDSFFGPFEKMETIFFHMEKRKIDFWGLTKFGECMNGDEYIPEHIQTFFYVIRSPMLHRVEFKEYWEKMPYYLTFDAVIKYHEIYFTSFFSGLGYRYDTLADTQVNDSENNIANNYLQYGTICYELIKKRHFPFLKKKQIVYDMQHLQTQENLREALEYIKNDTDYDIGLIWQNIIRTMNVSDLQRNLHLQYIIPVNIEQTIDLSEYYYFEDVENKKENLCTQAIAVFTEYRESKEYLIEYIEKLEKLCTIFVFSSNKDLLQEYHGIGYVKCCDVSEYYDSCVFHELFQHDYVCVVHDTDMSSEKEPSCTGKSYFYSVCENLIKNKNHVQQIIDRFVTDDYLGFLAPPKVYFAHYFGNIGTGWNGSYDNILELVQKLALNCVISYEKPPFSVSDNFWIRGKILQSFFQNKNFKLEYIPYLPYMWIYIVQDAGYYSGIVESSDYAEMNEVNQCAYLEIIATDIRKYFGNFDDFIDFRKILFRSTLDSFCKKYKHIYIYGAGYLAERYYELIPMAKAFIISDGQGKKKSLEGRNILYLSEICPSDDLGIVICLNEQHQRQVIPLLEERGIKHYLCI